MQISFVWHLHHVFASTFLVFEIEFPYKLPNTNFGKIQFTDFIT